MDPVTTGGNPGPGGGAAVIPFFSDEGNEQNTYSYMAAAQTPDGELTIVDLRGVYVGSHAGDQLLGTIVLDRTVVGLGTKHAQALDPGQLHIMTHHTLSNLNDGSCSSLLQ